jgi:hypothetical protein
MKPYAVKKKVVVSLLLPATMAILAAGCFWAGPPPEYPGYGYYGAYNPAFYNGDVIIGVGGPRGHGGRPEEPHMPARRLPAPAPWSRPASHSAPVRR